jgi:hypothetical protein
MDSTVFNYTDKEGNEKSMRVLGHNLLVRRCERNSSEFLIGSTDKPLSNDARMMVDSMSKQGWCHWCHVLAIGPDANKPRSPEQMKRFVARKPTALSTEVKYAIPWGVACEDIRIGDFVVLPEVSETNTQWRGVTGYEYDVLTDITNIIAVLPEKDHGTAKRCG